jgi:cobalamin transport system substrate-binding protein
VSVNANRRPESSTDRRLGKAAVVCFLVLSACGRPRRAEASPAKVEGSARFPVDLKDDLGRAVEVRSEPRRIATLLPSHTETVFALGLGSRVVGVDEFSDYPAEVTKLPRLGGMYDARLESVLDVTPDLVLASEASPATTTMERVGLTVWAGSARRLDDVYRVMFVVGKLVGRPKEAATLADGVRGAVDAEALRLQGLPRTRVYYELDPTPYAVGPESFIGELLTKAGGVNVVPAGIGEFPKVSPEVIAAADPEVVLGEDYETVARRPGWERTAAVKNHRVFSLTPAERAIVVRPGPRLAEGLRVLSKLLHPEASP